MKRNLIRSFTALALLGVLSQSALAGCRPLCWQVCDADGNCTTVCGVRCTFDLR